MPTYPFTQVNVFSTDPLSGNPLAVVHAAEGLIEAQMAALARWTNLSETTFLLPPTDADADYYVRIFTPGSELPFAGPPLRRTGGLEPELLAKIAKALALPPSDIVQHQWVDNGPG